MRSVALALILILATVGASSDEINDLASLLDDKNDVCADKSFNKTKELLMRARNVLQTNNYDLTDKLTSDAYDVYKKEESAYMDLIGEVTSLREKIVNLRTANVDMNDADKKNKLESGLKSAEIKLKFCDTTGARQIINELKNIK